MLKNYSSPDINILVFDEREDIVRTSTGNDVFNDGWQDPNLKKDQNIYE